MNERSLDLLFFHFFICSYTFETAEKTLSKYQRFQQKIAPKFTACLGEKLVKMIYPDHMKCQNKMETFRQLCENSNGNLTLNSFDGSIKMNTSNKLNSV